MDYLYEVWGCHSKMVENISRGNYEAGREVLIAHTDLLADRPT
jgi:hypothetical protein